ncbi:MAG: ABC-type transport auxiliary lipoprotein family protein [Nitrospiraceae bacterium]|nr:ABC-type transport auxiliary lipoprotein family protein [Nitrospiraceae bacterium]
MRKNQIFRGARPNQIVRGAWPPYIRTSLAVCLAAFSLSGCVRFSIPAGQSAPRIERYVPEYQSPRFNGMPVINAAIEVDRFGTVAAFDTTEMVYSPGDSRLDAYNYSRWRAAPGEMEGDFLYRDLFRACLFSVVFPYAAEGRARFKIDGTVERFMESDGKSGSRAELRLFITLLDMERTDLPGHALFQRPYEAALPLSGNSAGAMARGMGRSMARLSGEILADVYKAARESIANTAGQLKRRGAGGRGGK